LATKNLIVRGGADFSGMKKEMEKTQKALEDFKNGVRSTMNKIGAVLGTLAVGKLIKDSTNMAKSVEASLGQIERLMGSSANAFKEWANTQAKAYNMSKSEAYQYGAVFSNLLSTFTNGTAQTAKYTEDLLKAAAVVSSKTGRTMEDTLERIRSGLLGNTEAIEDLGINVNIAMIESTEAFNKFANGKAWAQLDFQTQQQIRYFAILEQASKKFGDEVANNTASKTAQFTATLKNIQLNIGNAFLPILNVVLPILNALASKLEYVTGLIAQFMQALFGKNPQKQAKEQSKAVQQQASSVSGLSGALGDTAKAAKKAAKAQSRLAGFDEITNIKNSSAADSSVGISGGGSAPLSAAIDDGALESNTGKVSKKIQQMANKVKEIFANLSKFVSKHKDIVISGISGIVAAFASYKIISNWDKIVSGLGKSLKGLGLIFTGLSWPILAVSAAIGILVAGIIYLWNTNEDFRNSVLEVWNMIKSTVTTIVQGLWETIKEVWDVYGADIVSGLQNFAQSILDIIVNLWENLLKPIISSSLDFIKTLWDEHLKGIIKLVLELVAQLAKNALEIWNKFISPIVNWLVKNLVPIVKSAFDTILKVIKPFIDVAADVVKGVLKALGGLIDFITGVFTGNWKKAWDGIKGIFRGLIDVGKSVWNGIKNIFSAVPNWFKNVFTTAWENVKKVFSTGGKIFSGIIDGIANTFKTIVNGIITGINKIIAFPFNKINSMLNKIRNVSILGISPFKSLWGQNPLPVPQIPKLATGGYIGANNPLLAIIGDNRNEGEIVAPESKLYEQTFKAISDALSQSNGAPINLTVNLGGTNVFRKLIDGINEEQRRAGQVLINI
jgi:phage-related protein